MEIKMTLLGALIYVTMGAYFIAMVATLARYKRLGMACFAAGFAVASAAFVYRWIDTAHWPMQNLFEVFLSLGMLCFPTSLFCRHVLKIGGQAGDMLIGVILMIPAGFVFHAEPQQLPPALQSPLFAPHVAVYMISYVLMFKATFWALAQLSSRRKNPVLFWGASAVVVNILSFATIALVLLIMRRSVPSMGFFYALFGCVPAFGFGCVLGRLIQVSKEEGILDEEQATYKMICLGFPFLTLGLILGSWWGKLAWGDYWAWDPKELWSLASWLVYLGYFHFRFMFGIKRARLNSVWAIAGMVAIFITLLWVNLSKLFPGLHNYAS